MELSASVSSRAAMGHFRLAICWRISKMFRKCRTLSVTTALAQVQSRCADQQVLEGNADATRCLLTLDAARQFRDFSSHRMHRDVPAEFFAKSPPPRTVGIGAGAVDTVGEFHQGHHRKRGI